MAGDWIKMRTDLYRDPKVIMMADTLMSSEGSLSRYVSQNLQCDMSVTRNVMRNATVGALVAVWGVARHQGKREGDDLVLNGCTTAVIDDVCDMPGFGAAMVEAGWLEEKDFGLLFPKFFAENNVDPSDAKREKNAIRQRRYRDRKRSNGDVTGDVTGGATVTHREEKRREEKSIDINKKEPAILPEGTVLQGQWDTDKVLEALEKWAIHLRHNGKNPSAGTIEQICMEFDRCGKSVAEGIEAINYSMRQSLANIHFPPAEMPEGTFVGKGKSLSQLLDEQEAADAAN